ncbi:MAG TPA: hypothetical protein VNX69_04755 [Steroidobacteraceae bacterium]|nr:hypothetical protein [Steroidobacteraceae bacterium]
MNAKHLACAVLVLVLASTYPAAARAGFDVGVTVGFAPPPLPVYVQPPCPSPGYVWAPGYWAYDDDDYYWVPGTWVLAPEFGLLWTPGYWSGEDGYFVWHAGYWAPHVGFYGGINYGFGYFGTGFVGGYWRDHDFFYNRAVTNITNVNITNVYNSRVYNNRIVNNSAAETRVSYNGGNGVHARPTRAELAASHEARRGLTPLQRRQVESARTVRTLRASVNHGVPPVAATNRPGAFAGRGAVAAKVARGVPSKPTAVAANFNGRGSSARAASPSAPIGAARQNVSDSRPFHSPPPHAVTRSVDPVRTSAHIAAAPQASRTPQPITYSRNPASVPRVAAQAPTAHTFNRPAVPSQYRANPPPSARSFPAQAPDRRWAPAPAPHGNAASGANVRPAREAQPAHANDPSPPRNGRHS